MKTSNYFAKLPQEASIKSIQTFRDYDLITLNLPAPRQRLCPRCGSTNCVIKDSGVWQTVRHLPSHHRGTAVAFHKRRLFWTLLVFRCFFNPIRSFSVSLDHLKILPIHTALSDAFLVALPSQWYD